MTMKVLELNDHGISIGDEAGVLATSPGYAVAIGKELEFGNIAASKSKLHPVTSSNEFWHRLGMEPLARPIAHYRHYADIAYSHLMHLAEEVALAGDVIIAVPGSFSRQQLAILLGLIKQSPFRAAGLIDTSVAATVDTFHAQSTSDVVVYADMQLHQVILTQLRLRDNELVRESVTQVPGVGWSNLADSLVQLITDAFIQQSRFNPQHNARWEQHMYDSLPGWLAQGSDTDNNLLLQIQTDTALHQAKLTRSSIVARLQPFYRKISQHLHELPGKSGQILMAERFAVLPGLRSALEGGGELVQEFVSSHAVISSCLRYQDQLIGNGENVNFTTRLRPELQSVQHDKHSHRQVGATHSQNRKSLAQLGQHEGQLILHNSEPGWLVNGKPVAAGHILQPGDMLHFADIRQALQLVQVQDGQQ